MSEFEYTDLSEDSCSDDDESPVIPTKSKPDNTHRVAKDLRLYYSHLFVDCFNLIDTFVKCKQPTYFSFLRHFDAMRFHEIYSKPRKEGKQPTFVSPHHYITTAQDALAIASKFLQSRSRDARMGAVYLLYTLHETQPLISYPIKVKMRPKDYDDTKELVNECTNQGLWHPAFCFYSLDLKKKITITHTTVNPCLEANYPRTEIRKHMGHSADKYFKIDYEERTEFNPYYKLQLMEHQMRDELTYINKLSSLALNREIAPDYKAELTPALEMITNIKDDDSVKQQVYENASLKKKRYRNKMNVAFPGKNDDLLEDMVVMAKPPPIEPIVNCHPKKKLKLSKKKRKMENKKMLKTPIKKEKSYEFSESRDSDSTCSSTEDPYGSMIQHFIEDSNDNEVVDQLSNQEEQNNL